MNKEFITFEQPVNEHMRASLRLEHLLEQAHYSYKGDLLWDSRYAIAAIIEILSILDRPDLKPKLTKELCRHQANIARLAQTPHVDTKKLHNILSQLEVITNSLQNLSGKIGQQLRENEFLNSIRQHLSNPGGACNFEVPNYQLWLSQPQEQRVATLKTWLEEFNIVQSAITLMMQLVRESSLGQPKTAEAGFFQTPLDPQLPCQLIQVSVPKNLNVYPEISAGRHGIAIRFYDLSLSNRPKQSPANIDFDLTICIL